MGADWRRARLICKSYAEAARQYVAMGYRYIGLGGLVRTSTPEILRILEEVHKVVPDSVQMHLFGLARLRGQPNYPIGRDICR